MIDPLLLPTAQQIDQQLTQDGRADVIFPVVDVAAAAREIYTYVNEELRPFDTLEMRIQIKIVGD